MASTKKRVHVLPPNSRFRVARHDDHLNARMFLHNSGGKLKPIHAASAHLHVGEKDINSGVATRNVKGFRRVASRKDAVPALSKQRAGEISH